MMLQRPSPSIADCLQRAAECEALAAQISKRKWKKTFRRMAERWLLIAQSRELAERTSAVPDERNVAGSARQP
jgi:hypothetical protein